MSHITAAGLQARDTVQQTNLAEILTALVPLVDARAQPKPPSSTAVRHSLIPSADDHTWQQSPATSLAAPLAVSPTLRSPHPQRADGHDMVNQERRLTALRQERDALEVSARDLLAQARTHLSASYSSVSQLSSPTRTSDHEGSASQSHQRVASHRSFHEHTGARHGLVTTEADAQQAFLSSQQTVVDDSSDLFIEAPHPSTLPSPAPRSAPQSPAKTHVAMQTAQPEIRELSPHLTMSQLRNDDDVDSLDNDPRAVSQSHLHQSAAQPREAYQGNRAWIDSPAVHSQEQLAHVAPSATHWHAGHVPAHPAALPLPPRTRLLPTHPRRVPASAPAQPPPAHRAEAPRALSPPAARPPLASIRPLLNPNLRDLEPRESNHRREQLLHQVLHNATQPASSSRRRTTTSAVIRPPARAARTERSQQSATAYADRPRRRTDGRRKQSAKARARSAARELSRPTGKGRRKDRRAERPDDITVRQLHVQLKPNLMLHVAHELSVCTRSP